MRTPAHAQDCIEHERTNMHIDDSRLRADMALLAKDARALKLVLRSTWTRPMAEEQRRLSRVRRRMTELCVLRAWSRGHCHVTRAPRDGAYPGMTWDREAWHTAIAARVARDYAAPSEETRA